MWPAAGSLSPSVRAGIGGRKRVLGPFRCYLRIMVVNEYKREAAVDVRLMLSAWLDGFRFRMSSSFDERMPQHFRQALFSQRTLVDSLARFLTYYLFIGQDGLTFTLSKFR